MVEGRTSKYEEELTSARNLAMESMIAEAEKEGANAIIGTRMGVQ